MTTKLPSQLSDVPVATPPPKRSKQPPVPEKWNTAQTETPEHFGSFLDKIEGKRPLKDAEPMGYFTNIRANMVRNVGEIVAGLTNVVMQEEASDKIREFFDVGYEQRASLQDISKAWDEGRYLGVVKEVLAFSGEHGLGSLPWFVTAINNPAMLAGMASMTGLIAEERAQNNGRDEIILEDIAKAAPAGIASLLLQRAELGALVGKGAGAAAPARSALGVAGKAGKTGALVGAEEALQETIEYAGGAAGTQAGMTAEGAKEAALTGLFAGGPMGAGAGGVTGAIDVARRRAAQRTVPADQVQAVEEAQAGVRPESQPEPLSEAPRRAQVEQGTTRRTKAQVQSGAVEPDRAQAKQEADVGPTPTVDPVNVATAKDASDIVNIMGARTKEVRAAVQAFQEGELDPDTLGGLTGSALQRFGLIVGFNEPELGYNEFRSRLQQYVRDDIAQKQQVEQGPKPEVTPPPMESEPSPFEQPQQEEVAVEQVQTEPVVEQPAAEAVPEPRAEPKKAVKAVAKEKPAQVSTIAQLRRRAGQLGVSAGGSAKAIQKRIEEAELAEIERKEKVAQTTLGTEEELDFTQRGAEGLYARSERMVREWRKTLATMAEKAEKEVFESSPKRTQEKLAVERKAGSARRMREAEQQIMALHQAFITAPTDNQRVDVLNRAARVLAEYTDVSSEGGVSAAVDRLIEASKQARVQRKRKTLSVKKSTQQKPKEEKPKPKARITVRGRPGLKVQQENTADVLGYAQELPEPSATAAMLVDSARTVVDSFVVESERGAYVLRPEIADSVQDPADRAELLERVNALRKVAHRKNKKSDVRAEYEALAVVAGRVRTAVLTPAAKKPKPAVKTEADTDAELRRLIEKQEREQEIDAELTEGQEVLTEDEQRVATYHQHHQSGMDSPDLLEGVPHAAKMPPKMAAVLAARLRSLVTRPGLTGNDFVAGLMEASQGFGRSDNVRRSRQLLRVLGSINLSDVSIRSETGLGRRGTYDHAANMVTMNEDLLVDPARYLQTAVHELVHAATVYQLRTNNDVAIQLEALRAYVDDVTRPLGGETVYAAEDRYGLTDVYEFVAEGLANPEFQTLLNSIALPARLQPKGALAGRIRSVWDALVNAVRIALGMEPRSRSALDAFLREASPMLTSEALGLHQSAYRLRKKDLMPQAVLDPATGKRKGWRDPVRLEAVEPPGATVAERLRQGKMNPLRSAGLYSVPRDVILKIYRRHFKVPGEDSNPLEDIVYHQRETSGTYHLLWGRNAALIKDINNALGDKSKAGAVRDMFSIALRSTMGGVHPNKPWINPNNRLANVPPQRQQGREELHAELQAQWNTLGSRPGGREAKQLYVRMQDTMKETFELLRSETLRFYARLEGVTDQAALDDIAAARTVMDLNQVVIAHDLSAKASLKLEEALLQYAHSIPGPYFPLRRTGEFVTYGRKEFEEEFSTEDEMYDRAEELRSEFPGATITVDSDPTMGHWLYAKVQYMSQSATQAEADALAQVLRDEGFEEVGAGRKKDPELPINTPLNELIQVAKQKTQNPAAAEAIREALMAMLPEARMLRSQLRRSYVEGASPEMLQSVAQHLTVSHRAVAHMRHSHDIQQAYADAETLIRDREKTSTAEAVLMRDVINELRTRQRAASEASGQGIGGRVSRHIGQMAFMRYLFDVSYLVMNSTQTLLITVPQLNGIYGERRTAVAMTNAYRDLTPKILKSGLATKTQVAGVPVSFLNPSTLLEDVKADLAQVARLTPAQRVAFADLFERAQRQGVLNSLQSEEMVAVGQGETWLDKLSRGASGPAQYVEFMNRLVTLHAAYNLELERPGSTHEKAIDAAITHTRETHFDYSVENRPRWALNPVGRLFGVFKMHAMGVMFRMGDYTMKLTRKQDWKEGARQVLWMLAMHGAVAGVLGSIMAEPIRWAMWMLGLVFDDEDDVREVLDDPDTAIRQMTHEWLGEENDDVAAWITDGLLPAMGARSNLSSLFFLGTPEPTDTAAEIGQKAIIGLGGAPVAYGMDILKAADYAQQGDWSKVFQKIVPAKQLANLSRMHDLNTEGVTDSKGNPLVTEDEFGFWPLLAQGIGFTPSKKQQVYMARAVKYRQEQAAKQRAGSLRQKYYRAKREDRNEVWSEIKRFNDFNPAERITMSSLRKGLRRRDKQARETVRGVYFHGREKQRYYNELTEFSTLD